MREIDEAMAKELSGGATTLCRCWTIERSDGAVLGFTDHDRKLGFDGVVFEPESGFTRTEMESSLGLSVDNVEAAGALRSDAITEADILRGLYDGAKVTQWLVDWREPSRRLKLFEGHAGELRRGESGFEMELQGLSERLNRPVGRVFQRLCDAELGDARCGVSLDDAFTFEGEVAQPQQPRKFRATGPAASQADGWFDFGRLVWTSGANAGATAAVSAYVREGDAAAFELWSAPREPLSPGDGFRVSAGCDKTSETCRAKFGNLLNFRGFPLMPGEDWLTAYPRSDEAHDGGSLFR